MNIDKELKCRIALKKGFTYDKNTGFIKSPTGKICTRKTSNGYNSLIIRSSDLEKPFYLLAHQFAYYNVYGFVPKFIDHIDRNKLNNKISNLRETDPSKNQMNRSNVKGYYFCKRSNRYISIIMVNYKSKQLGAFKTEEEARECYLKNKKIYHKI